MIENRPKKLDISRVERLPAMPKVLAKLINLLSDENSSVSKIVQTINEDPAIAAKILSLANSAAFSLKQPVTTIDRALVVIGFQELRMLALGTGLASFFFSRNPNEGFNPEDMWRHSLAVSHAAFKLAGNGKHENPAELMTAGLLHDLGKLVIMAFMPESWKTLGMRYFEGKPYYKIEQELGLDHSEIGFMLALNWGLPESLALIIRDHHKPVQNSQRYDSACYIHLADLLIKNLKFGVVHQSEVPPLEPILEPTGLTQLDLWSISSEIEETCLKNWTTWGNLSQVQKIKS